jgi:hypothetical protein
MINAILCVGTAPRRILGGPHEGDRGAVLRIIRRDRRLFCFVLSGHMYVSSLFFFFQFVETGLAVAKLARLGCSFGLNIIVRSIIH